MTATVKAAMERIIEAHRDADAKQWLDATLRRMSYEELVEFAKAHVEQQIDETRTRVEAVRRRLGLEP